MINTILTEKTQITVWENPIFERSNIQVAVLRLDKIHPTVSGNKWLKMSGYLQQALFEKKSGILTKGGPWSNHAHACAYACNALELSCTLWIKGNKLHLTPTLQDCTNWGAHLQFINRTAFYDEQVAIQYAQDHNLLYIPLGGTGITGIRGVSNYVNQLNLEGYTHAVCSLGTATTFAGIAFAAHPFKHIIGVESGTGDSALGTQIAQWQLQLPDKYLELLNNFTFGGYGKYQAALIDFMVDLYQKNQIPTDMVYTAKLFYAVQQLASEQYFAPNSKVLMIHSGGLQGNRSLPESVLPF